MLGANQHHFRLLEGQAGGRGQLPALLGEIHDRRVCVTALNFYIFKSFGGFGPRAVSP